MRVVLVTHDSIYARFLAASLHGAVGLDRVVVESAGASSGFYWRKLRRVGPVDFAFQAMLNRWFRAEGRRHLPDLPMPPHERVASVNELVAACPFAPFELVLAFGTSYVTRATLAATPSGILNLHTGYLPEYRGVKSEFWALRNGDTARLGWTLHYMTPALDAGDVVLRSTVPWKDENPAALRARLLRDAVPRIAELVRAARAHGMEALRREPQGDGRYYTTPTWREWREWRRRASR